MSELEKVITLSDGTECKCKTLGVFELDKIKIPSGRSYTYNIMLPGNQTIEMEYEVYSWTPEPPRPSIPESEVEEGSKEWYDYKEYNLYWGAIYHKQKQVNEFAKYLKQVREYILNNCIAFEDIPRIRTRYDWKKLFETVKIPGLTLEDLNVAVENTFQATFDGKHLLESFLESNSKIDDSEHDIVYSVVKHWEISSMVKLGMSEEQWSSLSVDERARKVVAIYQDKWYESLLLLHKKKTPVLTQ